MTYQGMQGRVFWDGNFSCGVYGEEPEVWKGKNQGLERSRCGKIGR